jgi:hypothetical protein
MIGLHFLAEWSVCVLGFEQSCYTHLICGPLIGGLRSQNVHSTTIISTEMKFVNGLSFPHIICEDRKEKRKNDRIRRDILRCK